MLFPDGNVPAAAGAGPASVSRDGGGVEEDAPGQEEEAEGQRGERQGKENETPTQTQRTAGNERSRGRATKEKKKKWSGGTGCWAGIDSEARGATKEG